MRPKWASTSPNMTIGQIVIIKEDNMPPGKWLLGKIIDITSGQDHLVRVVDLQCSVNGNTTTLRRPVTKVCVLPISDNAKGEPPISDNAKGKTPISENAKSETPNSENAKDKTQPILNESTGSSNAGSMLKNLKRKKEMN